MSWWVWLLIALGTVVLLAGGVFGRDDYGMNGLAITCVALLLLEFVGGGITVLAVASDRAECRQIGRNYRTEVHWEFPAGCFVRVGDRFVPSDQFVTNHEVK